MSGVRTMTMPQNLSIGVHASDRPTARALRPKSVRRSELLIAFSGDLIESEIDLLIARGYDYPKVRFALTHGPAKTVGELFDREWWASAPGIRQRFGGDLAAFLAYNAAFRRQRIERDRRNAIRSGRFGGAR